MMQYLSCGMVGAALVGLGVAGCAVDAAGDPPTLDSVSIEPLVLGTGCPDGWFDSQFLRVSCPAGWALEVEPFGGASCARCVELPLDPAPASCSSPWQDARLHFGCRPGFHMEYAEGAACKRCVEGEPAVEPECKTNEDCFRTGCAGEICSAEHAFSVCMWRPEFACYEDKYCGCHHGQCGWKDHPRLQACLADAGALP